MLPVLSVGVFVVAVLVPTALCLESCTTRYYTSPGATNSTTTKTHTSYKTTVTKTTATASPVTKTQYSKTVSETSTGTSTFLIYTTCAPTTTTVPTTSGFTPFARAKAILSTSIHTQERDLLHARRNRNDATGASSSHPTTITIAATPATNTLTATAGTQASTAATSSANSTSTYATHVSCRTTKTLARSTRLVAYTPSAATVTAGATTTTVLDSSTTAHTTARTTVHTSIATVFEACAGHENIATAWHGHPVNLYYGFSSIGLVPSSAGSYTPYPLLRAGNQSPRACCEAAFGYQYTFGSAPSGFAPSGFVYSGPDGEAQGACVLVGSRSGTGYSGGLSFWSGELSGPERHIGLVDPRSLTFCGECEPPYIECNCFYS